MADTLRQAIEVVLRSSGAEGLAELRTEFQKLGQQSSATAEQTDELAREVEALVDAALKAQQIERLRGTVEGTSQALDDASRTALALKLQLGSVETPTREMQRAFDDARRTVAALEQKERDQRATLEDLESELRQAGISTADLAGEQASLRAALDRTTANFREQAQAAAAARDQQAQLKARLAAGDEQFRRLAQSGRVSAEALAHHRKQAAGAAGAQDRLAQSSQRTSGILSSLRGVIVGLGAYFGFREAVEGVKNILGLGDAAERTRIQLEALYGSQEAGNRAFDQLKSLARENGQEFTATLDAAKRLKSFGLEPLNGTLQGLIDQNARLGGSQETLQGMILAVGQAWAKQKLQGEEILQLVERGVPVWDLLAKATGKSTVELQKLSEQGKLGRPVIKALLDEIAKGASGAAAANLGTLSGLVQQLRDRVKQFFTDVANAGAVDYFKARISALIAEIDRLAATGKLREFAKAFSDAIVGAGRAIEGTIRFIAAYSKELTVLAQAYVLLKAAQIGSGIVTAVTALGSAAGAAAGPIASMAAAVRNLGVTGSVVAGTKALGAGIAGLTASLGGFLIAATAVVGFKAGQSLGQFFVSLRPSVRAAKEAVDEGSASLLEMGEQARLTALHIQHFADQQTLAAQQVLALSAAERQAYDAGQQGLERYLASQAKYLVSLQATGQASAAQVAELDAIRSRLGDVRQGFADVASATAAAAAAAQRSIETGLSPSVLALVDQFNAAAESGKGLGKTLKSAFEELAKTPSATKIGDLVIALDAVGSASERAATQVREALRVELENLNGTDLKRFQDATIFAFEATGRSAADAAGILDTVLQVALDEIGVSAQEAGVKVTEAGRRIIDAFTLVAQSAQSSGAQIAAAFESAIAQLTTVDEVEQLGIALRDAFDAGKISADQLAASMSFLRSRIAEIQNAVDPLTDAFRALGIESQRSLNAAAETARESFDAIIAAVGRGEAATADAKRAFEAYARAMLAAVADADRFEQAQVKAQLALQGAAIVSRDKLVELGLVGREAGEQIAAGATQGAAAIDRLGDAADSAASSVQGLASASASASSATNSAAAAANNFAAAQNNANAAVAFGAELSDRAIAKLDMYAGQINRLSDAVRQQEADVERVLEGLRSQQGEIDPLLYSLDRLRAAYDLVDEAQLQQISQEAQRIAQDRERIERERAQAQRDRESIDRDSARQRTNPSTSSGSPSGGAWPTGDVGMTVNIHVSGSVIGGSKEQIGEELARITLPAIRRQIGRGAKFP